MAARARRTTLLLVAVLAVVGAVERVLSWRRAGAVADDGVATWPPLAGVDAELDVAAAPGPEHSPVRSPGDAQTPPAPDDVAWVLPEGGTCPATHPVKAKVLSGIFHPPGSPNYARTRPDRCYPDAAAAEADGLRPPRR